MLNRFLIIIGFIVIAVLLAPSISLGLVTGESQRIFIIDAHDEEYQQGNYDLSDYIEILPDPTGKWTIDDVTAVDFDHKFILNDPQKIRRDPAIDVCWVRLTVKNNLDHDELWLLDPQWDTTELYTPEASGGYSVKKTGFFIPIRDRYYKKISGAAWRPLPLRVKKGLTQTYYWRIT
ncbi:7TM-DISM domain-containing protein [candidate division CSSED10-310 bacterium]|uniref:7TM-DISM domain-containing protein n=1 Tax=candidate division CSSED10-310 bacterium TaxID=2855610 RepID=A0ABV6YS65_UNCC1